MANGKWQRADWRILHLGLRGSFFDGLRLHFRSCISEVLAIVCRSLARSSADPLIGVMAQSGKVWNRKLRIAPYVPSDTGSSCSPPDLILQTLHKAGTTDSR